jgi:Trypsin
MTGAQKDPQILLQRGTEGYELIAQTAPFPTSSKSQIESQGPLRIIHHTLLSVTSSCSTACRMMRLLSVVRATCILVAIALVPMSTCHKGSDVISWQYEVPRRLRGRLRDQLSKLGSDINVTGRIVGGDVVGSSERFPYYVALLNSKYSHVCGGSLIAPDAVLTAAHCK